MAIRYRDAQQGEDALIAEIDRLKGSLPSRYPFLNGIGEAAKPVNLKIHIGGSPETLLSVLLWLLLYMIVRRFTDASRVTFRLAAISAIFAVLLGVDHLIGRSLRDAPWISPARLGPRDAAFHRLA